MQINPTTWRKLNVLSHYMRLHPTVRVWSL